MNATVTEKRFHGGRVTLAQRRWLDALNRGHGIQTHLWRLVIGPDIEARCSKTETTRLIKYRTEIIGYLQDGDSEQSGKRPGAGRPTGSRNKPTFARAARAKTLTDLARETAEGSAGRTGIHHDQCGGS